MVSTRGQSTRSVRTPWTLRVNFVHDTEFSKTNNRCDSISVRFDWRSHFYPSQSISKPRLDEWQCGRKKPHERSLVGKEREDRADSIRLNARKTRMLRNAKMFCNQKRLQSLHITSEKRYVKNCCWVRTVAMCLHSGYIVIRVRRRRRKENGRARGWREGLREKLNE